MAKNIATTVETEWENFAHVKEALEREGYSVEAGLFWDILSPDKFERVVVSEIRLKKRDIEIPPNETEPVKIVLSYPVTVELWQTRKWEKVFEFRDFLDKQKIPYTERYSREEVVQELKLRAETLLDYAKRIEGK